MTGLTETLSCGPRVGKPTDLVLWTVYRTTYHPDLLRPDREMLFCVWKEHYVLSGYYFGPEQGQGSHKVLPDLDKPPLVSHSCLTKGVGGVSSWPDFGSLRLTDM